MRGFISPLFSPIQLSSKILPSRILLAPLNTGFAQQGVPTESLLRFHQDRSGHEMGISMVGNVAVSMDGASNHNTPVLNKSADLGSFARLATCIKARGSLAGIQLAYCPELAPKRNWVAGNATDERRRLSVLLSGMSDVFIEKVLNQFLTAAQLAVEVGFDVIQIHAAHGYLLSLLLNPLTNGRSGNFSLLGPWLNVFAIALRERRADCILSVRLSLFSGLTKSIDEELACIKVVSELVAQAGFHLIDYTGGFYTVDRRLIYPGIEKGVLPLRDLALGVSRDLACAVGVSGNVQDVSLLGELPPNVVVSIGRALIADPQLLQKTLRGDDEQIIRCERTARCHYFSRGKPSIECGVNRFVGIQVEDYMTYE
ncbi:MAG: hypothetical protein U0R19_37865 [Bryobacteraceae bacterium]